MKDGIPSEEDKALRDTIMYREGVVVFVRGISAHSDEDEAWYITEEANTGTSYLTKASRLTPVPSYEEYHRDRVERRVSKCKKDLASWEETLKELEGELQ